MLYYFMIIWIYIGLLFHLSSILLLHSLIISTCLGWSIYLDGILYFLRMSSREGVRAFDEGCSRDCADSRADTAGVVSLKVSLISALLDLIGVSIFSNFSFFTFWSCFCIALVGLLRTGADNTGRFLLFNTSFILPCLHPMCRTRLCFCLNTLEHNVHLRSSCNSLYPSCISFMKCLQRCCSRRCRVASFCLHTW